MFWLCISGSRWCSIEGWDLISGPWHIDLILSEKEEPFKKEVLDSSILILISILYYCFNANYLFWLWSPRPRSHPTRRSPKRGECMYFNMRFRLVKLLTFSIILCRSLLVKVKQLLLLMCWIIVLLLIQPSIRLPKMRRAYMENQKILQLGINKKTSWDLLTKIHHQPREN